VSGAEKNCRPQKQKVTLAALGSLRLGCQYRKSEKIKRAAHRFMAEPGRIFNTRSAVKLKKQPASVSTGAK
jgi:hypothetical protein